MLSISQLCLNEWWISSSKVLYSLFFGLDGPSDVNPIFLVFDWRKFRTKRLKILSLSFWLQHYYTTIIIHRKNSKTIYLRSGNKCNQLFRALPYSKLYHKAIKMLWFKWHIFDHHTLEVLNKIHQRPARIH